MAREVQRSVLPIPDQPSFGLVTYDARDPDTKFPPIEPLRPPEGAAVRPQSSSGGHGQHHRDGDLGARPELAELEHQGAAGADAERLFHRPVRQVP